VTAAPDLAGAAAAADLARGVVARGTANLVALGGVDASQTLAYELAHLAAGMAVADAAIRYGEHGPIEAHLACAFVADVVADAGARSLGRESLFGVAPDWHAPAAEFLTGARAPEYLAALAETPGERHLDEDFSLVAATFHRFAAEQVRPHAEHVHRTNGDIPEELISGLAELGGLGLSVPEAYGGYATGGEHDYLGMVVATEELTWGSLGIGGSLITRPEILTRALVNGGTESQRAHWLPRIASGEELAAVAVTEPDFGSDVAGITTTATRVEGGWVVNGTKTWCTFAARATVLMLLVRTDPDRTLGHRGLSVLLVPKPVGEAHGFRVDQDARGSRGQGRLEGRPIDTIGYRGMHSYELSFEDYFVDDDGLVGGEAGLGRGFYLQMAGFENGRIQTAARALGVMQAAYDAAVDYARGRRVFGAELLAYELTRAKLGRMAAVIQCARQFSYEVARRMASGEGSLEASMAKAYVCRAAEWVTREAMQLHGGMGYAEEYAVSRYFVDARVLSIFEGADETLCLKVIARRLVEEASR
jgi:(2S)-methylsuccinyl-CoA dehydrogenase